MFNLSETDKKNYKSIILLNELVNSSKPYRISSLLNDDNRLLEPLFVELMAQGYVTTSGQVYKATKKGEDVFNTFMKRYQEYLRLYDVFCFVDLGKGEFAFSKYFDFETDEQWDRYKNSLPPSYEDVRIAVSIFKKINPAEIVFMSFINENRFDTTSTGWQMDLLSDSIWNEIIAICDSAIKPEDLGVDVMVDMISQGAKLALDLIKMEDEKRETAVQYSDGDQDEYEEYVEEEYIPVYSYYEPYYDPYYVSDIWLLPLFW